MPSPQQDPLLIPVPHDPLLHLPPDDHVPLGPPPLVVEPPSSIKSNANSLKNPSSTVSPSSSHAPSSLQISPQISSTTYSTITLQIFDLWQTRLVTFFKTVSQNVSQSVHPRLSRRRSSSPKRLGLLLRNGGTIIPLDDESVVKASSSSSMISVL